MALVVGWVLVKQYAGFVDEIFIYKKAHEGVGLVAPSSNGYIILCACYDDKQRKDKGDNPAFHAVKTRKMRNYCFSGNFTSTGRNLEVSPPFL